ncbi:MAG TPA: class I SAM-dependent methyltransferase [Polyangiaceae bacterium]|nr:class I SAM-dependent methyltransferase [Polyangiaceae bacterium]
MNHPEISYLAGMRRRTIFQLLRPISALVARQLSHPSGWIGRHVMTRVLNRGNRELITSALDSLRLSSETRLLDVGFGGGLSLQLAHERGLAKLFGVERSLAAVEQFSSRHPDWIRRGELTLAQGTVERLPLDEAAVDAIISTNTVYFWTDLAAAFSDLHRVLAPGGQLALGFSSVQKLRSFDPVTRHGFLYYPSEEIVERARNAGFTEVRLSELRGRDTEADCLLNAMR